MDAAERRNRASIEAAEWWSRLQSNLTLEERGEWVDWLRESHIHVAEMLRMAQVHGALEQFERWLQLPNEGAEPGAVIIPLFEDTENETPIKPSPPSRYGKTWVAIAASFLLICILAAWIVPTMRGQLIATDRGERREVVLDDGSVVQVDPETRVRVQFERDRRRVHLDRGRALFRVAKNPQRPFLVETDLAVVRAIGTSFGVEREHEGTVVTVAEGKVAVAGSTPWFDLSHTRDTIESPSTGNASASSLEVTLIADQQVTVQRAGTAGEPVRQVDSQQALAWAQGRLIFENEPLADVIAQFNRYNRVQIRITDNALAQRPLSGTFNASDPESLIAFLQGVVPVRVERDGEQSITLADVAR